MIRRIMCLLSRSRKAKCDMVFVYGHPLLSQCPKCLRYADEHNQADPGQAFQRIVPGVDWLTPMLSPGAKID